MVDGGSYHPQQSDLYPHFEQRHTACIRYTSPPQRSQKIFSSLGPLVASAFGRTKPVLSGVTGLTGGFSSFI
jgi:hypothetical protein